jgi:hypothetical protein
MIAWHFTGPALRDGSPVPPIGEWLVHEGDITICKSGLHASVHPFDALQYAPGSFLHKVECEDIVSSQDDKFVCRRRKIIASRDVTELLYAFACDQALSVAHLWEAPDVVKEYLTTRNPSLRAAARDAACVAACVAAWNAARDAAWDAARAAAWDAACVAAWDAAREAARAKQRILFLIAVEEAFK